MGFLSGIVHAIGSGIGDVEDFFGGGNKKKANQPQQQSSNNQNNNNQGGGPSLQVQPVQQPQLQQSQQNQNQPAQTPNGINLTLLNNDNQNTAPNQLVKANPQPTPPPSNNQGSTNAQDTPAPAQHASILHDITHNPITNAVGTVAKDAVNATEGVGAAIGRAGTGAVEGLIKLPDQGAHLGDWIGSQITGQPVTADPFTQALDKVTNTITSPIDNLNRQIDTSANTQTGAVGKAVYKPAQVVANVAAAVPAAADLGGALLSKVGQGDSAAANLLSKARLGGPRVVSAAPADTAPAANEVASGVKSVNPEPAPVPVQPPSLHQPGEYLAPDVRGPNGEILPQVSGEAPNATPPVVHTADPARTQLENAANDTSVPAYQRTAAKNQLAEIQAQEQAAQDAAQAKELGVEDNPAIESPAYQRQGKTLPSEAPPTPAAINDGLNNHAAEIAKDPAAADMVSEAYRNTGSTNPLSLVAHTLASTSNKGGVRDIVQKLIPEAKGNALNRAVNTITGADNQADVIQALHEASNEAHTPTGPLGKLSTAEAAKPNEVAAPSAPEPVESPATTQPQTTPNPQSQSTIPEFQPPPSAETAPLAKLPAQTTDTLPAETPKPVEQSSLPPSVSQPTVGVNPDAVTAENAPRVQTALNKEAGLDTEAGTHEVMQKQEMVQQAQRTAQASDLNQALDTHATQQSLPNTPQAPLDAAALIRRIYNETKTDPRANTAIANLSKSIAEYGSKAGQGVNVMNDVADLLPAPARANVTLQTLVKAWGDDIESVKGAPADLKNVAGQSRVLNNLTSHLEDIESTQKDLAANEGKIQQIQDSIDKNGTDSATAKETASQLSDLEKQHYQLQIDEQVKNTQAARYFNSLLPAKSLGERSVDWARTSMLTSIGGRIKNVFNVSGNSLYEVARSIPQSWIGRITNAFKGAGTAQDTSLLHPGQFIKGAVRGAKESYSEITGTPLTKDLKAASGKKGNSGPFELVSTADNKGLNKVRNFTQGLVKAPGKIIGGGLKQVQLMRDARQAAQQAGFTGEGLKLETQARMAVPSKQALANSQQLQDVVSHMNKNPLADMFSGFGKLDDKAPPAAKAAMGLVKNTILPFAKYPATFVWNGLRDRNVVADAYNFAKAAKAGDATAIGKAIAGGAVDTGGMYLGYHLAANGTISTKDANGYSDNGLYFHFGNRSYPLGVLGMLAEPLVAGAAMHNSFNKGGNPLVNFGKTIGSTVWNTIKEAGGQSLIGAGNTGLQDLVGAFSGNSGKPTPGDAAAVLAGQAAGTYIPGAASDLNSLLNMTKADPSHNAALTKVTKGDSGAVTANGNLSTAKNIPASEIKSLENRIPGLSQILPRNPAIAATDPIDRSTGGTHTNAAQTAAQLQSVNPANPLVKQAAQKAQLTADKKAFMESGKSQQNIHGIVYEKDTNGKVVATKQSDYNFLTQNGGVSPAQRGIDQEAFKNSGKQQNTIHGIVYQRADDGTVKAMEQKDYDYKNANTGMTEAKNSGDFTGYQKSTGDLLSNISSQLQNPNLSSNQIDALTNKAMAVQKSAAEYDSYGGFTKDPNTPTFKGVGNITGAKDGYVKQIQRNAAKYNLDGNALLAVSSMEGLGGGVGDGGHAFGPFQMNDAGGVLTGKYPNSQAAQAYAESPAGIEDAIKQISKVAGGLKGQAAINAIVGNFERPADPAKEIAGASAIFNGGDATLSPSGGASVTAPALSGSASKAATKAADLVKSNTIGSTPNLTATTLGKLAPSKVTTSVPILQKIIPSDLVKMRSISVAKARA